MSDIFIERATKDRDNPYGIVLRSTFDGSGLSFEARGMLVYILMKPDEWRVQPKDLQREGNIGRDKAYNILKELIDKGYAERVEVRDSEGKFDHHRVRVFEKPQVSNPLPEKPDTDKPDTDKPDTENPHLSNYLYRVNTETEINTERDLAVEPPAKKEKPKEEMPKTPKKASNPQTHPILNAYIDALPYKPVDVKAEVRAAKKLADEGYEPADIKAAVEFILADPFWDGKHLSLQTVAKQLPAIKHKLLKRVTSGGQNGRNQNGNGTHYERPATAQFTKAEWQAFLDDPNRERPPF